MHRLRLPVKTLSFSLYTEQIGLQLRLSSAVSLALGGPLHSGPPGLWLCLHPAYPIVTPLPLSLRSPPYEDIKFGYPIQKQRFLLLSTNLAREWLQIDADLLLTMTSTADELSRGTNINDLERLKSKNGGISWICLQPQRDCFRTWCESGSACT